MSSGLGWAGLGWAQQGSTRLRLTEGRGRGGAGRLPVCQQTREIKAAEPLCRARLNCTALHCTVLCCAVLCCGVLRAVLEKGAGRELDLDCCVGLLRRARVLSLSLPLGLLDRRSPVEIQAKAAKMHFDGTALCCAVPCCQSKFPQPRLSRPKGRGRARNAQTPTNAFLKCSNGRFEMRPPAHLARQAGTRTLDRGSIQNRCRSCSVESEWLRDAAGPGSRPSFTASCTKQPSRRLPLEPR